VTQFTAGCHIATDGSYWANQTAIPQSCQGTAYRAMLDLLEHAAVAPLGPGRVLLYDQAEEIAYQLALYTYSGQSNIVAPVAAWLNPSTIDTNVCIGGGGDQLFYDLQGNDFLA
jgi:hypothetical protein